MIFKSHWIVSFVEILTVVGCSSARKLKYSTVLWNSGAHAYEYTYKKDPYHNIAKWRHGRGELTNLGANQTYKLGQFLRKRYHRFLDPIVAKEIVSVKSTDDDKNVASALAVLAGMYPVNATWNASHASLVIWRPIAIRTSSPNDNDNLSLPLTGNSNYDRLKDDIFSSKWMKEYEHNNSQFLHNAFLVTGEIWNMSNIYKLADNILTLNSHDVALLRFWDMPGLGSIEKLKEMYAIYLGSLFTDKNGSYTKTIATLQGGILLNQIVRSMKNKIQHAGSKLLMSGYSVPTTTLVGLLVTLGNYDWIAPGHASSLIFELYSHTNGSHEIEVSYRNGIGAAKLLKVYECNRACPFDQFERIASDFITFDNGTDDSNGDSGSSDDRDEDIEDESFSTCDGLLLGFIATLFVMSFMSIGIVLYLLGRPVTSNPNPVEFERLE